VTRAAERGSDRDLVERKSVRLHEISLCQFPAYELATVAGQRSMVTGRSLASLAETRGQLVDHFGRIRRW
jgi:phage head maturation protease